MEANLLKHDGEWIIAQVEAMEGDAMPGDPDVWLVEPYLVDYEGLLVPWAPHASEREFNARSSDISIMTTPSKKLLARYIESLE